MTLEIVMRAVFGVSGGERLERMRAALREMLDWTTTQAVRLVAARPPPAEGHRASSEYRERWASSTR